VKIKLISLIPLASLVLFGLREFLFPSAFSVLIFYLLIFNTIFLPGFVLAFLSFRHKSFTLPEWVALSACLGFAVELPPHLLAYIFKIPVESLLILILLLISLPSAIIFIFLIKKNRPDLQPAWKTPEQRKAWYLFWALSAGVVIASFLLLGNIDYSADFYGETAFILRNAIDPKYYHLESHFKGSFIDGAHTYIIPILWETVLAKTSNLPPYETVLYLQPVLSIVEVCVYFFFFNTLFKNKTLTISLCLLFFVQRTLLRGPLGSWQITNPTAHISLLILLPICYAMALRHLAERDRVYFCLTVFLGVSLFLFNTTSCALFFVGLLFFGLTHLIFNKSDLKTHKSLLLIGFSGTLLMLPLLFLRYSHPGMETFQVTYKYHTHRVIETGWSMFYINPLDEVYHNQLGLLALILSPWLLTFRRKRWALFLFAILVIPNLIRFIPPLTTFISHFMTYLFVYKLSGMPQWLPVLGLFLYLLIVKLERQKDNLGGWDVFLRKAAPYIAFAVMASLAGAGIITFIIKSPLLRASLRELFHSLGFRLLWDHKHLLIVILPILSWVVFASVLELAKRYFSRMENGTYFLGLKADSSAALIFASLFALLSFLYAAPAAFVKKYQATGRVVQSIEERLGPPPGMRYLQDNVPAGQIIFSDPYTSWALPAYCNQYVFVVYARRGGSLNKPDHNFNLDERLRFCEDLLESEKILEEKEYRKIIDYGISYLYLSRSRSKTVIFEKFESFPQYFRKVFESEEDTVYEVLLPNK